MQIWLAQVPLQHSLKPTQVAPPGLQTSPVEVVVLPPDSLLPQAAASADTERRNSSDTRERIFTAKVLSAHARCGAGTLPRKARGPQSPLGATRRGIPASAARFRREVTAPEAR